MDGLLGEHALELLLSTEEGRFGADTVGEVARLWPQGRLGLHGPGAVH